MVKALKNIGQVALVAAGLLLGGFALLIVIDTLR